MQISNDGLQFIMRCEGTVLHPYKDVVGVLTIGCGHVIKAGESFTDITIEQAMQLLRSDVAVTELAINRLVTMPLTQNMYDALCSFVFNVGTGAFRTSTLLKMLNAGNPTGAANEFLRWVYGGGHILQGLVNRRAAERTLFMTPALPTVVPGEVPGDRIVRIFRSYVGCSLSNRRDDLGELVARGVDDPKVVVTIKTNCATSALGVMALVGVKHPLLKQKYVNGKAITWVRKVGIDLGALVKYAGPSGPQPKLGSLLRYNTAGKNDDHVEWLLGPVSPDGRAAHGGGGRTDNALTETVGDITMNYGRPLVEWWDPDLLGINPVPEARL